MPERHEGKEKEDEDEDERDWRNESEPALSTEAFLGDSLRYERLMSSICFPSNERRFDR